MSIILLADGDNFYLKKYAKRYNVEEKVKFLGSLPHDKVFDFMRDIDIYIQPSNAEGMCRTVIEAMSMACPCIVSGVGGNPELIDCKYVFKKKKYKNLIRILENTEKKSLTEQAWKNFEKSKEFEVEKLNEKMKIFYSNISRREY